MGHSSTRSEEGKDDDRCYSTVYHLRAAAEIIKQEQLTPLEEDAAYFKARMELREMIRSIENQRFQKLLRLCKEMKEKKGTDGQHDATIEFERALEVAGMMS